MHVHEDVLHDSCRRHPLARQQYSAERMCLAVLGGEPLDALQGWVANLFARVPSGRGPRPSFAHVGPPYEVLPVLQVLPIASNTCVVLFF